MSAPDHCERNLTTSYGLTLVAGLPLPAPLTAAVLQLRKAVEAAAPGQFTWYTPDHFHVTLAAPLRGRYREQPPIRRHELPTGFAAFLSGLVETCAQLPPMDLVLAGCRLHNGTLAVQVAGGDEHAARLRELLRCCEGFDLPKHPGGILHLSCGFLPPGADEGLVQQAIAPCAAFAGGAAASLDGIVFVHYSNRTLSSIVGQIGLPLGQTQPLALDVLLERLRIGD